MQSDLKGAFRIAQSSLLRRHKYASHRILNQLRAALDVQVLHHRVLRMHPAIVLGACAGAGTSTPALGALIESSNSRVSTLSYGVGYVLGNVVLALGASAIVRIVGQS